MPRVAPHGWPGPLFRDDSASDAVTRIACRIRFHVVCLGVNHQRRSTVAEDGMRIIAHRDARSVHGNLRRAIRRDRKIRHVARVRPFRILQSVMFAVGIEMTARRRKRRAFTFRVLVNVDGVLARRQPLQVETNVHALFRGHQARSSYAFALPILEFDRDALLLRGQRHRADRDDGCCNGNNVSDSHDGIISKYLALGQDSVGDGGGARELDSR